VEIFNTGSYATNARAYTDVPDGSSQSEHFAVKIIAKEKRYSNEKVEYIHRLFRYFELGTKVTKGMARLLYIFIVCRAGHWEPAGTICEGFQEENELYFVMELGGRELLADLAVLMTPTIAQTPTDICPFAYQMALLLDELNGKYRDMELWTDFLGSNIRFNDQTLGAMVSL